MKVKEKIIRIVLETLPVLVMIGLIPVFSNDYLLTAIYVLIIAASLEIRYEKNDYVFLIFGFFIMMASEFLFISTGVEAFIRNSLFGLMPLWLPVLWAYGFVAMKRAIIILNK